MGMGDVSVLQQAKREITEVQFAATYPTVKTSFAAITGTVTT